MVVRDVIVVQWRTLPNETGADVMKLSGSNKLSSSRLSTLSRDNILP